MIRQTMELRTSCMERSCHACRESPSTQAREQLMAAVAAAAFLLCGLGVILLEGGLLTAVLVGLAAGGGALALTVFALDRREKRRLKMCGDL